MDVKSETGAGMSQVEKQKRAPVRDPLLFGRATLGFYVFNPDDSDNRLAIVSLGAEF